MISLGENALSKKCGEEDSGLSMQIISEQYIETNPVVSHKNAIVVLAGAHRGIAYSFGINEDDLSKHTLVIGATGCGKTTILKHYVRKILSNMRDKDTMVIFDPKGDYFSQFYDPSKDIVLSNSIGLQDRTCHWNLFEEVFADCLPNRIDQLSQNIHELCKALFEIKMDKTNNQFFPNAACELLEAIIMSYIRMAHKNPNVRLDNESFCHFLKEKDIDEIRQLLSTRRGNTAVLSYIDEDASGQSLGVYSEMMLVINEYFIGAFCKSESSFSIRNYVKKHQKRILFIEYDLNTGAVLTPIYRLLIDLALKQAMTPSEKQGSMYLLCDELRLLPKLKHIEDAVNFGRSLGVKVIAGIQSIEQIYHAYGKSLGNSILAGFSNILIYRSNDWATRDYARNLIGRNVTAEYYKTERGEYQVHVREGFVAEDWELSALKIGEAVVILPFEKPFKFHFDEYQR